MRRIDHSHVGLSLDWRVNKPAMFVLLLLIPQGLVPLALPALGTAPVNSIIEVYVVGTLLEDLKQRAVHIYMDLAGLFRHTKRRPLETRLFCTWTATTAVILTPPFLGSLCKSGSFRRSKLDLKQFWSSMTNV